METWPGSAYPLGATYDGGGTNFAIFREAAERVELCLFDTARTETRIEVTEVDAFIWHCYLGPRRCSHTRPPCRAQRGRSIARPGLADG